MYKSQLLTEPANLHSQNHFRCHRRNRRLGSQIWTLSSCTSIPDYKPADALIHRWIIQLRTSGFFFFYFTRVIGLWKKQITTVSLFTVNLLKIRLDIFTVYLFFYLHWK
uniref:Uncharacterized protein n=1 Tax=Amphiprion percula TaxID=161767 RepID=A0A3P8SI08_AMPPE